MARLLTNVSTSSILVRYGLFLIFAGIVGYGVLTEGRTASLYNGILFGSLMVLLGVIHLQQRMWTHPASLSAVAIFTITFYWRLSLLVQDVASDSQEKLPALILLIVLALASSFVLLLIATRYRH